ncbi:SGNH hydrolase-type esterase domain-containing protein [Auriculariales sp. MPI-PUGE-AT-0066]|nr:SGNH hydrolase-type esterase domain-containing protein [Auriculariales sp. MPI-PUGE-AT-0066]
MNLTQLLALLVVTSTVLSLPAEPTARSDRPTLSSHLADGHWVHTWVNMPMQALWLPPAPYNESGRVFENATLRQTAHLALGGSQLRLRISNVFGGATLPITKVTVALPVNGSAGISAVQADTVTAVTFSGQTSFDLPMSTLLVSDPIDLTVLPQSMLTISIYLANGQASTLVNSHQASHTTSFWAVGDYTEAEDLPITNTSTQTSERWFFISGVEVWARPRNCGFVIVGDSITDGTGSTSNGNDRWPDRLLARMQKNAETSSIAVLNQANGGNRVLADGRGPSALSRIERDVLAQSGIRYAMIFEGVNDIGTVDTTVEAQDAIIARLKLAYIQMAHRVHALGIPLFGATITPFGSPQNPTPSPHYSDVVREQARLSLNEWIRGSSSPFDAVIDFDAFVRDPANGTQLNPLYDSGDQLHLNPSGYQVIADNFPLDLFTKFANGVSGFE